LFSHRRLPLQTLRTLYASQVDNQSAIHVARNPEHHGRMKHLDLRLFWLRNMVNSGVIAVRYIPTADMAADLLTTALARVKVTAALPQLGLTAP
jgi:hypothetical protein